MEKKNMIPMFVLLVLLFLGVVLASTQSVSEIPEMQFDQVHMADQKEKGHLNSLDDQKIAAIAASAVISTTE